MSFRVFWAPHAEGRLEQLLVNTTGQDQASCIEAARRLDQALVTGPSGFGESRYEAVRVGFVPPLGIQFEVLDDVRTVIVYDVWRIDSRKTE